MKEILTIFDDFLTPIGEKERQQVHFDGEWHETFQCWFFEKQNDHTYIYFQKRAKDKSAFPNLYDITAAGHIEAGERKEAAGLREIREELGIEVSEQDLEYTGFYKEELNLQGIKDREICHIYLYEYSLDTPFSIGDEVEDVVKVSLDDFLSVLSKKHSHMPAASILTGEEKLIVKKDLVPHDFYYYQRVIQSVQKLTPFI